MNPEPVRVRLYGLFSVTKRGYLIQLGIAVALLAALFALRLYLEPWPPPALQNEEMRRQVGIYVTLLDNLHWIVLALAALVAVEAFFVLRAFARREANQRSSLSQTPSSQP